jgi:hypothetical protein
MNVHLVIIVAMLATMTGAQPLTVLLAVGAALALLAAVLGSISHTLTLQWKNGSNSKSQSVTLSADTGIESDEVVNANTSNVLLGIAFNHTTLQSIFVLSNQDVSMKTNNTTGVDSFSLSANKPLVWYTGCGLNNPFSADVTALYFSNAGNTNANVNIRVLGNQ